MDKLVNSYLVKRGDQEWRKIGFEGDEEHDPFFPGVRVLKVDGFTQKGKAVNIYTAQWVNSQTEDYMVTTEDDQGNDVVVRENVDIAVTFIVSNRYGASDVRTMHDAFVAYMTDGELYIKSEYTDRTMRCVCLQDYKPTTVKLKRQKYPPTNVGQDYIIGTITLHTLSDRAGGDDGYTPNPYPSSGGGGGGGGTDLINAQFVKDYSLNKTQDQLNAQFNAIPIVSMSVSGKNLIINIT